MLIIPAVDIKSGKCVRLTQGKLGTEVVYKDNPIDAALIWQKNNAKYLHVVDLDGAFTGRTVNFNLIKDLIKKIEMPIEIGGGIRTLETIENYIKAGADRIILGTKVFDDQSFLKDAVNNFGDKIAVGIDAKEGNIVSQGWVKDTNIKTLDFTHLAISLGAKTIIYTDTSTDGMLKGPNFSGIEDLLNSINNENINIILSGGISTLEHIEKIKSYKSSKIIGIIIGKALYEGKLKPEELWIG